MDKIVGNPITKPAVDKYVALNNMVKEHGADKVANFLAAANAENWSTLTNTEQQTRVNSYKEVVGGIISLDILLGAGGKGIKTIADLAKVNQVVGAVDKATTTSTLGKISKNLAELKQKKNAASYWVN